MESTEQKEKQVLELIRTSGLPLDMQDRLRKCMTYAIGLGTPLYNYCDRNTYVIWGSKSNEECEKIQAVEEQKIAIGASKLGGLPHLPPEIEWPKVSWSDGNIHPHKFVAQFNLADVIAYDRENLLPNSGMLYFFYPEGSGGDPEKGLVYYYDGDLAQLRRTPHPPELPNDSRYTARALSFSTRIQLPYPDEQNVLKRFDLPLNDGSVKSYEEDDDDDEDDDEEIEENLEEMSQQETFRRPISYGNACDLLASSLIWTFLAKSSP